MRIRVGDLTVFDSPKHAGRAPPLGAQLYFDPTDNRSTFDKGEGDGSTPGTGAGDDLGPGAWNSYLAEDLKLQPQLMKTLRDLGATPTESGQGI